MPYQRVLRYQIISQLQHFGALSRSEIARQTGVSRSTMTYAIRDLMREGLVIETETQPKQARGRPSIAVALDPIRGAAIGLDFGYRHIRGVIADLGRRVLARAETEVQVDYSVDHGMRVALGLVEDLVRKAGIDPAVLLGIGVGLPCPIDEDGVSAKSAMMPTWASSRVKEILSAQFRLPVVLENESRLAARAERTWGAARGVDDFVFIKLHSGVGGAVCVNGRFVGGARGGAGELGHMSLDLNGPICRCGKRGCLETYAGIPAVLDRLKVRGRRPDLREVLQRYRRGDRDVEQALNAAADRVGQAVSILCDVLNPSLVLIGGSLAGAGIPFLARIERVMRDNALELNASPLVRFAELGSDASAMGGVTRAFELFAADRLSA